MVWGSRGRQLIGFFNKGQHNTENNVVVVGAAWPRCVGRLRSKRAAAPLLNNLFVTAGKACAFHSSSGAGSRPSFGHGSNLYCPQDHYEMKGSMAGV
jgi:hypothetical protein